MDLSTEKALRVARYTKTSADGRYAGGRFDSGYQTIKVKDESFQGQRDNAERLSLVDYEFKDKVVLDIGCNMGGMLHEIAEDIEYGVGVDFNSKCINAANFIAAVNNSHNLKFFTFDLEKENINRLWDFVPHDKIDVCFFLALCFWVENWKDIIRFCAQISDNLLFETNAYPEDLKEESINYVKHIYTHVRVLSTQSDDDSVTKGRVLLWCSNTPFEFDEALAALAKELDKPTKIRGIEPFESTGCQRKVYLVRAKHKDYFLGVGGQRNWADYAVSKFLRSNNISVVNTIVSSEDKNGTPYLIREYVPSTTLSNNRPKGDTFHRTIKGTLKGIRSRVASNKRVKTLTQRALKEISAIHSIKLPGYGFINKPASNGKIEGMSKTWLDFLRFIVNNEGDFLREKNIISDQNYAELTGLYEQYFNKYDDILECTGCFLAGDIGWSNILIDSNGKAFLTDFEFAMIGDPAFEFSFMRDYTKKHLTFYMDEHRKIDTSFDAKSFVQRMKLYEPLKLLFVASYANARNGREKTAKSQYDSGIKKLKLLV